MLPEDFVFERSIAELQDAMSAGRCTSRDLVQAYLRRIAAYDHLGPALNSIVTLNPAAAAQAGELDAERGAGRLRGPLHGIPILLKDNFDTADMPTTGGTRALAGHRPERDAFQVRRLRQAGAVILGKTTMHELACGITNISSLTGATRNPYDPQRVPGGSSGGTAAAVAASFAAAGMGSDTCGSIRIPAACQNLVGLRATQGLSSRSGIMPLSPTQDLGGPLARTVRDLAIMLDATVGPDPDDPPTLEAASHIPASYLAGLRDKALAAARIGVPADLFGTQAEEQEVSDIVRRAIETMRGLGAQVVDVQIPGLADAMRDSNVIAHEFKFALAAYLASHAHAPVKSLAEILRQKLHHQQLDAVLRLRDLPESLDSPAYGAAQAARQALRLAVCACMQQHRLDVLAYPVLRTPPVEIGHAMSGANSQLSPGTGLPAIAMPAGFTQQGLPVGIELLGRAYAEQDLLNYAAHWEQTVGVRRPPRYTPALA
jgi:Asp-tRNA(Asn)/Glu-tRNA(Gln) amidotransferase A subunit family amidase